MTRKFVKRSIFFQDSARLSSAAVAPLQPACLSKKYRGPRDHEENVTSPSVNSLEIRKRKSESSEQCNSSGDAAEHTLDGRQSLDSFTIAAQLNCVSPNRDRMSGNSMTISEGNSFMVEVPNSPGETPEVEEETNSEADLPVSVENCEYIVKELQNTLQKAVQMYSKVTSSDTEPEVKSQMTTILCDSFCSVRKHLNSVACLPISDAVANKSPFPSESPDKSRTTVLLEHYSELLIEMVTQKLQLQN